MKIVVTFALSQEFAHWRRIRRFDRLKRDNGCIYLMRSGDAEVYAVMLGIGMRSIPSELQELLAQPADLCIASGLAGSLKKHRAGTIVVAKAVKTSGPERAIHSDKSLVETAEQLGAASVDFFFTSPTVVNSRAEKFRLAAIADAVEMESFYVFGQASKFNVPSVGLRAISDPAETSLPIDLNRVVHTGGGIRWGSALYEIAKAPLQVPRVMRFGLESARAARNLAHFLDRYTQFLITDPHSTLVRGAETK